MEQDHVQADIDEQNFIEALKNEDITLYNAYMDGEIGKHEVYYYLGLE